MEFLCEACSVFFADGSLDRYAITHPTDRLSYNKIEAVWHAHHLSASSHRDAISQGCVPCSWIPLPEKQEYRTFLSIIVDDIGYGHVPREVHRDITIRLGQPQRLLQYPDFSSPEEGYGKYAEFKALPIERVSVHDNIATRSRRARDSDTTGKPEVLGLARAWLEQCMDCHEECIDVRKVRLPPRRLLALIGSYAWLIDTTNEATSKPYATLSHCWGGLPSFVLTSQNMKLLTKGLPFSEFDPTFRDAMVISQALGIEYLWIDCYCIIQGADEASQKDWREQSNLMGDIYANGVINLGAAHGKDSRAGCFVSRERQPRGICNIHWQPNSNGVWPRCYLSYPNPAMKGNQNANFSRSPLFSRGWVLQERFLARRMLYFGDQQIFWDCARTLQASETWPFGVRDYFSDEWAAPGVLTERIKPRLKGRSFIGIFKSALELYIECRLSFPEKDRLVAFEGVGRRICELHGTKYAAGFPMSTLPATLCWKRSPWSSERIDRDQLAPSWHWASSSQPIQWLNLDSHVPRPTIVPLMALIPGYGPLAYSSARYSSLYCIGRPLQISFVLGDGPWRFECRLSSLPVESYRERPTQVYYPGFRVQEKTYEKLIACDIDNEADFERTLGQSRLYLLPVRLEVTRSNAADKLHFLAYHPIGERTFCQKTDEHHENKHRSYKRDPELFVAPFEGEKVQDIRAIALSDLRTSKASTWPPSREFWRLGWGGLVLSLNADGSFKREGTFLNTNGERDLTTAMQKTKAQLVIIK